MPHGVVVRMKCMDIQEVLAQGPEGVRAQYMSAIISPRRVFTLAMV